ncbi:GHKL domain-containing protein [Streptococcus suis]|nr:GHKL domain-containing protein [Streptococcus suis]
MIRFIEYTIPLVLLILLFNLINLDFEIVKMKAFKNYVYVGNFIFAFMLLSITIWTLILQSNLSVIKIFGPTVALAHFLLFLFLAQYMKSQQRIYEVNLEVIRREEENRNLQKNEYSAFNLKNIEDLAIRNMLAQSILEAEQYDIQFNCYVSGHISQVNVPMLEMIQILSIMLTNSIESAIISKKPLIEVALYRDKSIVTIVIKNSRNPISLDKRTIWEVGVSSKGEGRGIGLYNLRRLVNRHDNLTLETQIDYDSFTHILKIM